MWHFLINQYNLKKHYLLFFKNIINTFFSQMKTLKQHYFSLMFLQSHHELIQSHHRRSLKPPSSISKTAIIIVGGFCLSPLHVLDGVAGK